MGLGSSFLRRLSWRSNKRSRSRLSRVPEEIVNRAHTLRESGEFDASIRLLLDQPSLGNDVAALNTLALGKFARGETVGALQVLDQADQELRRQQWGIEVNRANVLKCAGHYVEAAAAARRAVKLRPDATSSYLISIAVSECAGRSPDREFVRGIVNRMDEAVPDWRSDRDVWDDLLTDSDYVALRRDRELFFALFGVQLPLSSGE